MELWSQNTIVNFPPNLKTPRPFPLRLRGELWASFSRAAEWVWFEDRVLFPCGWGMSCGLFCFQCLLGTNMSRVWTWLYGKRGLPFCKATSWTLPTWVAGRWISIMCWTFRTVSSRLRSSLPTLTLTARRCPATGSYPVSTAGMEVVGNKW